MTISFTFLTQVVCGKQPQTPNSKTGSAYQDNTAGTGSHEGEVY